MNVPNASFFAMDRISVALCTLGRIDFDVIVVGSGYGGSIAASRLARAGQRVCLLERGAEILPGQYPRTLTEAQTALQVVTAAGRKPDSPAAKGMMEVRLNTDMHVVLGSGLGGGSLINAGVAIAPDPRVFAANWPKAYAGGETLAVHYDRVREMLGATKLPARYQPNKLTALEMSADAMGLAAERLDINVTFDDGPNAAGVFQAACNMCGDCCSGCNYGAKNTLLMNYLPDAHRHGAVIVTEAGVDHVAKHGDGWQVVVEDLSDTRADPAGKPVPKVLTAKTVILAAGSLGSTEILFRSLGQGGLTLADANLGKRFSGNGDILGFGFAANMTQDANAEIEDMPMVYSIGAGANPPDQPCFQPGPCITGVIKVGMGPEDDLARAMVIEDGVAPGALSAAYPALLFLEDAFDADFSNFPDTQTRLQSLAALGNAVQGGGNPSGLCYSGAIGRTQSFLVMSHDTSGGSLRFDATTGMVQVDWPGVGEKAPYPRDNDLLRQASEGIWANYIANPLWTGDFGKMLVTVHPVGGCGMADSAANGVVDADCRVFTGVADIVYEGLLVCDGAVVPTSLGVNPLLTISAITERAMDNLITRRGWVCDTSANPASAQVPAAAVTEPASDSHWTAIKTFAEVVLLLEAAALACTFGAQAVGFALTQLIKVALPEQDQETTIRIVLADLEQADLTGDIRPALTALAADIMSLGWAYEFPADGKSGWAALLDAFIGIVKDVSPSLHFDETMRGFVSPLRQVMPSTIADPYLIAEATGRSRGQAIVGNFTVDAPSMAGLDGSNLAIAPVTGARLGGVVLLTGADATTVSYQVTDGTFDLLQPDGGSVETWVMRYRCQLEGDYRFSGTKYLRRKAGSGWWGDLTTLFVDLQPLRAGVPALQGVMRLGLQDLATQVGTIKMEFKAADTLQTLQQSIAEYIRAGSLHAAVQSGDLLHRIAAVLLSMARSPEATEELQEVAGLLEAYFGMGLPSLFGKLILRTYGGLPAYLNDFPAQDAEAIKAIPAEDGGEVPGFAAQKSKRHVVATADGSEVRLYHFPAIRGGAAPVLGPIILAPGFSTTALSYAMLTNERSLVQDLLAANYDVWLFDNRSSPLIAQPDQGYTIDDIVQHDWPTAVNFVLEQTGQKDVQVLAHCVGALTAQMALLSGSITAVRQLICSQVTVHPVTNWFNMVKADSQLTNVIVKGLPPSALSILKTVVSDPEILSLFEGMPKVSSVSTPVAPGEPGYTTNMAINMLAWNVPFAGDTPCLSPTCHRIFGIYGPSYAHAQLNEATHNAIRAVFGEIATRPFEQLALIMERARAVDCQGLDNYLPNFERLRLPFHMIAGSLNQIFLPDGSFKTQNWLKAKMPDSAALFTRHVIDGYAHMDCFIGKNAHLDVFPHLLEVLGHHSQSG